MENKYVLSGTVDEIVSHLQNEFDHMMDTTGKWLSMLAFDPYPETGCTPKDVVWRKNKACLYRYVSRETPRHPVPILMIYALINKAYILDLIPGFSLVEHLVRSGYDVYLLDWGEFEWEDRRLGFGDLIEGYIRRAVQKVCQTSNSSEISLLGYCMGGTMAAMYEALYSSRSAVKNMLLLAAPIDFTEAGIASIWLNSSAWDADKIADTYQLIPGSLIDVGVKMLKPVNNYWGTYTRLWRSLDEGVSPQAWKALNKWVNDYVNFPGEAFRQWIKDFYQENRLVKDEVLLKGKKVELAGIGSNLLVLSGEKDHLVLPSQCDAIMPLVSSEDKCSKSYPVGHGGLVFGSHARQEVYPFIDEWLAARSE